MKYAIKKINEVLKEEELQTAILSFDVFRRQELLQMKSKRKQMQSSAVTMLLYDLLQEFGLKQVELIKDHNGYPSIKGHPELYVSLSHSGEYVAAAVSRDPIGIDIQKKEDKNREAFVTRYFTKMEQDIVFCEETIFDESSRFLMIWTGKESYLKMVGTGIRRPLKSIEIDIQNACVLDLEKEIVASLDFVIDNEYVCCFSKICSTSL